MTKQATRNTSSKKFIQPPDAKPWHRTTGETTKAFEAFEVFLNLETDRSKANTAKLVKKTSPLINRWADKYNWEDRALAFDHWRNQQKDAATAEAIFTIEKANRLKRNEIREAEFSLGKELLELGRKHLKRYEELLKYPVVETRKRGEEFTRSDGVRSAETIIIKPLPSRVGDPIKAIEGGLKFMRQSVEMPTEIISVQTPLEGKQSGSLDEDIAAMTNEELDAEIQRLEAEAKKIAALAAAESADSEILIEENNE